MHSVDEMQKRLVSVAMQIMDICSPFSRQMLKKYLDDALIKNSTESALNFARLNMDHYRLEMDDDTYSIVQKLKQTIILLEILRKSDLVSEQQIYPIVVECTELLDLLQTSSIVN
jgi:hypothetical protein